MMRILASRIELPTSVLPRDFRPMLGRKQVIDRWKAATGIELDDGAAANAAVRTAANLRQREAEAMARGMQWLLSMIQDGHVPSRPDLDITVKGDEVRISDPDGGRLWAVVGTNRVVKVLD